MPDRHQHMTADSTLLGSQPVARANYRLLVRLAGALGFAGLTFVGANIYIPLEPVPVTLQTLFVMLSGAIIGRSWGGLSQGLYVAAGASGLPLFAGGAAGLAVVIGPTGGYLSAFVLTPLLIGFLIQRRPDLWWQAVVFSIATAFIFALGVAHLTLFYTHDLLMAMRLGLFPFIPGAIVKIVAAVSIYRSFSALARYRQSRRS